MRVKQYRKTKGISQARLAQISGVSQSYIAYLERGERHPTIPIAIKLANALGVSLMELIGDPNEYVRKAGENQNNATAG